jgi:hypothetical protein
VLLLNQLDYGILILKKGLMTQINPLFMLLFTSKISVNFNLIPPSLLLQSISFEVGVRVLIHLKTSDNHST